MALYRRYRPSSFDEVIGQDRVVAVLRAALRRDQVGHALLLEGSRGSGKTTLARIVAKGVNCQDGPTDTPCGACDACTAIDAGSCPDVIELDAASHRGVDDVRSIRERLHVTPMHGRRLIVIIDEAHMLTREAQNALLKSIEEPPPSVHFIFATTDAEKLLDTIRSRCQRLRMHRPTSAQLTTALRRAADGEGINVTDAALAAVVRAAGGAYRDALALLDQLLPAAHDGDLTAEQVAAFVGRPGPRHWSDVLIAYAQRDRPQLMTLLAETDLREALDDLIDFVRLVLYAQQLTVVPEHLAADEEERQLVSRAAAAIDDAQAGELIAVLRLARKDVLAGGDPAFTVESGLLYPPGTAVAPTIAPVVAADAQQPAPQAPPPEASPLPPSPAPQPAELDVPEPKAPHAVSESPESPDSIPSDEGERAELPGPAVTAAAFPALRLALRARHPDVYLHLRTARAETADGKLIVRTGVRLPRSDEQAVRDTLKQFTSAFVKFGVYEAPAPRKAAPSGPPLIDDDTLDTELASLGFSEN